MKTLITNKFFRAFAVILLLTLSGGAIAAGEECTYNADNQITTDVSIDDWCIERDSMARKVSVYKFGLCTELPYANNFQSVCEFIYESDTALELIAEKGVTSSVSGIGDFFLTQDKLFTHSVLLLDYNSATKGLAEFTEAQTGRTGTGTYCWSNGRSHEVTFAETRSTFSAECGDLADADPQWNSRSYHLFADVGNAAIPALERNFPSWDGGWTNILLDSNLDAAAYTSSAPYDFDSTTNTKYWLAGRGIDSGRGVTVTSLTSGLDIQFKVSWGVYLSYNSTGIWSMSPAGFDLTIALK
jgi:hypothetical protein